LGVVGRLIGDKESLDLFLKKSQQSAALIRQRISLMVDSRVRIHRTRQTHLSSKHQCLIERKLNPPAQTALQRLRKDEEIGIKKSRIGVKWKPMPDREEQRRLHVFHSMRPIDEQKEVLQMFEKRIPAVDPNKIDVYFPD
jgi:hypothetical protein